MESVSDAMNAQARLAWSNANAVPFEYLGFAWDLYLAKWVETGWNDTLWQVFWPPAMEGLVSLNYSGGYHAWISNYYADGAWWPCLNPWTGIIYSGPPHTPLGLSLEIRAPGQARLHWKPEVYGTWHYQIIAFKSGEEFIPIDGPSGYQLWHFIDYAGGIYDHAKASFFEGWADFVLPGPGEYWFFMRGVGWLPPFPSGDWAQYPEGTSGYVWSP